MPEGSSSLVGEIVRPVCITFHVPRYIVNVLPAEPYRISTQRKARRRVREHGEELDFAEKRGLHGAKGKGSNLKGWDMEWIMGAIGAFRCSV